MSDFRIRVAGDTGPVVRTIQYGSQTLRTLSDVDARVLTDGFGLVYSSANDNFYLTDIGSAYLINANIANLQIALSSTNANVSNLQIALSVTNNNISYINGIDETQNTNIQNLRTDLDANIITFIGFLETRNGINITQNTNIQNLRTDLDANVEYFNTVDATQNTNISNLGSYLSSNVAYIAGVDASQNTNITNLGSYLSSNVAYIAGVDATQNTNISNLGSYLSSNVAYIAGVDATQNTNIQNLRTYLESNVAYIAGVDASQNTNISNIRTYLESNVAYIAGVDATQNTNITNANTLAQQAYTLADTKFNSNGGTIAGHVTIQNNLNVLGSISYTGNVTSVQVSGNTGQFFGYAANGFNALYAGIPTGFRLEPQISVQVSANYDGYSGINMQNINSGSNSSSDLFITADNGTVYDGFVDLGMASSTYSYPGYNLIGKNDGYLFATGNTTTGGGNMIIGTGLPHDIIFATGGITTTNEVMRITSANTVVIKTQVPSTSTTTGALQVKGGLGVTGNVYANNVTVDSLTTNEAVFTDDNNKLVSKTVTGTGSVILSTNPTLDAGLNILGGDFNNNILIGSAMTTGSITIGSESSTGGYLQIWPSVNGGNLYLHSAILQANKTATTYINSFTGGSLSSTTATRNIYIGHNELAATVNVVIGSDTLKSNTTLNGTVRLTHNVYANNVSANTLTTSQGATINATTQDINIGTTQTTGVLNLGTNAARTSRVNIGSNNSGETGIYVQPFQTGDRIRIGIGESGVGSEIRIGGNEGENETPSDVYVNGRLTIGDNNYVTYVRGGLNVGSTSGDSLTAESTSVGNLTATGTLNLTGSSTVAQVIATDQTTGTLAIGGAGGTAGIVFGRSTVTQAVNMATGATTSGNTKTVNIGTNGLTGSTTNINLGSIAGTSTSTLNGRVNVSSTIASTSNTTGALTVAGGVGIGGNLYANTIVSSNVSIGTSLGVSTIPLQVEASAAGDGIRVTRRNTPTQYLALTTVDGSVHRLESIAEKPFQIRNYATGFSTQFYTNTNTLAMSLLPSGNVGIKTATANFPLDVNGTANISGLLYVGNNLSVSGNVFANNVTANNLTASKSVFTDSNKKLISIDTTGSAGEVVLSNYPTITGPYIDTGELYSIKITGASSVIGVSEPHTFKIYSSDTDLDPGPRRVNILTDAFNNQHGGQNEINIGSKTAFGGTILRAKTFGFEVDSGYITLIGGLSVGGGGTGQAITIGEQNGDGMATPELLITAYTTFDQYSTLTANCVVEMNGIVNIGGVNQTPTIRFGRSTTNQTVNVASGATSSGNIKTLNLGVGGLSGSTSNVNIGSIAGTSTTRINGNFIANLANSTNYSYNNLTNVPIPANAPYSVFSYNSTITPTDNTNIRITCGAGNLTINPPSSGTDGSVVRMWIIASGGDRTVSLNASIKIPRSSFFTSPQTILSGDKARLSIQYDTVRGVWELVSFVNGY